MLFEQVTVVGVGLIGGSVGLAARARKLATRVVGVGRDPRTLSRAVELGAIDSFSTDLASGVTTADLVVVCTPVDRIADTILKAAPHVRSGTIFTDVGSTKQNILEGLAGKLSAALPYVPAHPLAGAEKAGVEHAQPDLFQNRVTIITSNEPRESTATLQVKEFWLAMGSRVVTMSPEEHDRVLASTSHLPHAVASGVAISTPINYLQLSAGGFRDTTRIAAGDPTLWTAIFQANRDPILSALRVFTSHMAEFQRLLETGDGAGLARWLAEAKQVRDALGS
ncbi:MAG: prephenate dehydrogenase/arogenate dehydrogenase family protein [Planctomycetaceae bacterium]|nr:prephenate dehydrogenase/arogenate dehydrogenase family protein [Planctomycetaceae bacterium]